MMKPISTVRCEAPRNRGVLRRCESPMATPGRSGLQERRCAGRSILPKWIWIFLTLIPQVPPENLVGGSPGGRNLDKVGQTWPKLAKIGQGWPKLDKAGQIWTAGGQVFQPFCGTMNTLRSVKQKTRAPFLAGLCGSAGDRPLCSGNETRKKASGNPALSINSGCRRPLADLFIGVAGDRPPMLVPRRPGLHSTSSPGGR
jgi:hypothetical protein